ncbi:hypothetical protein EVAR_54481_1 [Eumeta japonica]|uniref:Uncharacterized protein n=1 Tax=Eumeta variegata TaxID=151549 RepID=A0A4C1YRL8_EUMVA|nr:hypothetical protein EVAR_54481_1 [Eumeta japonica]
MKLDNLAFGRAMSCPDWQQRENVPVRSRVRVPVAHSPPITSLSHYRSIIVSIYSSIDQIFIPIQEVGNKLVTPQCLRVFMVNGGHILSGVMVLRDDVKNDSVRRYDGAARYGCYGSGLGAS